jgi:hypothetical protein
VLVADWSEITTLVTTEGAPPDVLDAIRSRGVNVFVT